MQDSELIQAGAAVAPRVTMADIEASISSEHYFTAGDGCLGEWQYRHDTEGAEAAGAMQPVPASLHSLTFCILVMRNGFAVVGESACAAHENFNAEIGRKIAREDAINKIWPLMGYELKSKLAAVPRGCVL